jgi:predicted polyphosphate/ATP-dependent NAD kinase
MHSGVFAVSPEAAAELAQGYIRGELRARETEIVDVDEELYRAGELQTRLYAVAKTPYQPVLVQERKRIYSSSSEEEFKDQIALFASEFMRDGSAYILGAGTTTSSIAELLGVEKTLLGVDVVREGKLLLKDASERDLLALLDREKGVKVIVSPSDGAHPNWSSQQISAAVATAGAENNSIHAP